MGSEAEKKGLNFRETEKKWQEIWDKKKIYAFEINSKKPTFSIDTPPPTVSGGMHMGHAFAYAQQDFIARYKRMRGFNVFHPFGLDDNGLATQRFVEKKKGIKAKNFSREEYIKIVLAETAEAEDEMKMDWTSLGMSFDWNFVYRTIDEKARKIAQHSFLDIYRQERIYRKEAPVMWCPECEVAIAQAELEDKEFDSVFNDVYFELEDGEKITIATTRPELLPACVAVFVHPDDKRNRKIVGKKVKVPLFNYYVPILADHRVDPEKGSGIVMCCTFGDQTDMEWFKAHNLPSKIAITEDGKLNELSGKYKGMQIKKARQEIIEDLKKAGLLGKQMPIKHVVNVHERCKTEIEFLVKKAWYLKYLDLKDEFIAKADEITWYPAHMKSRLDNWINGLQWDWCLSRQRYYGVPFPLWYCKKCGKEMLADEKQLPVDPLKDKPLKKCSCGSNEFIPESDVFDTWFTSSLTPQINCSWKLDNKFFEKMYPMDLRPQGHDIIALWTFNTIVKGVMHHGKVPWKHIMINGWALDPKGKKMSKSLGNVIPPQEMMEKYSADILRYWAGLATLGEDVPFQEKEMVAGRKFLVKLHNAANFVSSNTKDFDLRKCKKGELKFRPNDLWILSRLESLKKNATKAMDVYEFSKGLNPVRDFFWLEFADYYIEEVKYRLYDEKDESRKAAQFVLISAITDCLKMLAPFIPHTTEEIMHEFFGKYLKEESIHLEKWPEADEKNISGYYEKLGNTMNEIISALRKYKSQKSMPLNSELKHVSLFVKDAEIKKMTDECSKEIMNTMKVLNLEVKTGEALQNAEKINDNIFFLVNE